MIPKARFSKERLGGIAAAFGVLGIVTILASSALSPVYIPPMNYEAESGDLANAPVSINQTGVSGNSFVTLSGQGASGGIGAEIRPMLPVPAGAVNVKDYGAAGDGIADDAGAITAAIAAAPEGGYVYFPAGTYRHDSLVRVNKQGIKLWGYSGAALHATNDAAQSVALTADNTGVYGLDLTSTNTTQRGVADEAHRITAKGVSGTTVRHNKIKNGSGAGIFTLGSHDYLIEHNIVDDTLADAIHNTGGSYNGIVRNNTIKDAGDDCVAVVSYDRDQQLTHDIEAYNNDCRNGEARGMTVVGGRNIHYHHNYIERTFGAGMYIAAEQSFATYGGLRITFTDNEIVRANDETQPSQHSGQDLDHAAIFVYSDFEGTRNTSNEGPVSNQNEDVIIARNTIRETVNLRAHIVVRHFGKRINVLENIMTGSAAYRSGPLELNDVGTGNFNSRGNTNNGMELEEHIGDAGSLPVGQ